MTRQLNASNTELCFVTRAQRRHAFLGRDIANKDDRAALIAQLYPILRSRLPIRRETWMAESESMGVFDAMSLALSHTGVPETPIEAPQRSLQL